MCVKTKETNVSCMETKKIVHSIVNPVYCTLCPMMDKETSESCVLYVVSYDGTRKLVNPVYCTLCPMMG